MKRDRTGKFIQNWLKTPKPDLQQAIAQGQADAGDALTADDANPNQQPARAASLKWYLAQSLS